MLLWRAAATADVSTATGLDGAMTAIASVVSVTTLLFSLTIVPLQLASSRYSPRLLQT